MLTHRLDDLVAGMADSIVQGIEVYRTSGVKPHDLHDSLRHNTSGTLAHLTDGQPLDLSGPAATGRTRALQGVPLPEVLRAYQLSFSYFWDQLLLEAVRSGPEAQSALLRAAGRVWGVSESYSTAVTAAYRDALAQRLVETDRRRSALVAALVDGPPPGSDTVWEIARMLGFPFEGTFLLVTAESHSAGEPPLPGLDVRCQAIDVAFAWRAEPGHEIGVLSLPARGAAGPVLDAVRAAAGGRVGVSPAYTRLDQTPRSLRYAQVALESLPAGTSGVRQLEDTPLTEMVMNNLETTRRAVNRILGGVLSLPENDRTTLLATARAWLEAHGSAAEAARALYCHENTVRYRMRRLEEYLRGSLDNPEIVAELAMAINAVGAFPVLLDPHTPTTPTHA
ncbi:PucR family transcriptional regulator [Streptacidiphilus sp. MAP12-33]|uniref:PucR family transcriptional regulator n=1 Tax=Streptacidiphilus sp. MAP12-33 TaxID=3156266 RepID=UPI0035193038